MAIGESALEGSVLVIGEDRVPRPSGAININDTGMSFGGGNRLAYFAVITAALTP